MNHIQPEPKGRGGFIASKMLSPSVSNRLLPVERERLYRKWTVISSTKWSAISEKTLPPCVSSLSNQSANQSISRKWLSIEPIAFRWGEFLLKHLLHHNRLQNLQKKSNQPRLLKLNLSTLGRCLYHKAGPPHSAAKRNLCLSIFSVDFKKYNLDLTLLFQYIHKVHTPYSLLPVCNGQGPFTAPRWKAVCNLLLCFLLKTSSNFFPSDFYKNGAHTLWNII